MHAFGAWRAQHIANDQSITREKVHLFGGICKNPVLGKNMLHSHRGSRCATTA
jgi:hypothetical protein